VRFCVRCLRAPTSAIDRGGAAAPYVPPLRQIVHALKYDDRRALAVPLARLMRERTTGLLDAVDWVVPVPLHPVRRLVRGFNQAEELAHALGRPVLDALQRTRATRVQADLPAAQRHDNVAGAFHLRQPRWTSWRRHVVADRVRGACVLLVDDVRTTGATLEACAYALKVAGAREVRTLTAASVETTRPR